MKFSCHFTILTVCHFHLWIQVTYVTSLSLISPSFPPSPSLLPHMPALVTISFVSLPNQSFSFRPELISPSLIVDAILQSSLLSPLPHLLLSSSIFCSFSPPLSHFLSILHCIFHCNSLQMGLLYSVPLLGNLRRVVEQCLDWMWLAWLSILYRRIGAMHKILCWQLAVLHCTVKTDYQSLRLFVSKHTDALLF